MEGGRIVQAGTPAQIYANPANDYVADFVAHMNPLGVLRARDVTEPGEAEGQPIPADMPVGEVMAILAGTEAPLPVSGETGLQGRVSRESVLRGLLDPRRGAGG